MELTAERAYEAIINGAKCERGDLIYDWIHDYRSGNHEKFMQYIKRINFDQYLHDFKIWNKCKHVLKRMPSEEDEEPDENDIGDDGEPINWTLYNYYDRLFKDYYLWKPIKSRLEIIIEKLEYDKKELIEEKYEHDITYKIFWYESSLALLKEWVLHSGISTKQLLIEQLPLDKDINQLILDLKLY